MRRLKRTGFADKLIDPLYSHGRHSVSPIPRPPQFLELIVCSHSLTNDGNAILREIEVAHPAAKSMIELSRTQDEEVGDGTTSVIILGV